MSDLEPIELQFLINSPELLAELQDVSKGFGDVDAAVASTIKKYDEYKQQVSSANSAANSGKESLLQSILAETAATGSLTEAVKTVAGQKAEDAIATKSLTAAQALYSVVVGTSTGALKVFRIALASTGIGLIILLIGALVANWDKITASVNKSLPGLSKFGDKMDEVKSFVMGFLDAYLKFYEVVIKTLLKLATFDFSGAINNARNAGREISKAFNDGKNEQDQINLKNKNRKVLEKSLKIYEDNLDVEEARTGKTNFKKRATLAAAKAQMYDQDTKEYSDAVKNYRVEVAKGEHAIAEEKKKAADKASAEAEKRRKQEEAEQKKRLEALQLFKDKQANFIKELEKEESAWNNRTDAETSAEAKVKSHFDQLREKAKTVGMLNADVQKRINDLEQKQLATEQYKAETEALLKELKIRKEMYAAFETYKAQLGETEAKKLFAGSIGEFENFGAELEAKIKELKGRTLSVTENDRLKKLQEQKNQYDADSRNRELERYADAALATATFEEKKALIEQQYREQKRLLESKLSGDILKEKLALLEQQKAASIAAASDEVLHSMEAYRRLGDATLEMSRQQLQQRVAALKAFLATAKNLSPEQKAKVDTAIQDTENLKGGSRLQTRMLQLETRKKLLIDLQNEALKKQSATYAEIELSIEQINKELEAAPYQEIANKARDIADIFGDLASAIGDSNASLADTFSAISTIAGAVADAAGGIAEGILSGNPLKAIGGIVKGLGKIFSLQKAARESERKAQEEIKKRQDEINQAQLDYHAELRKRILDETKLNDLYQSRVDAIKEEMAARSQNSANVLRDYQIVFQRLLGMQTTVDQVTKKYGGFLGIGRKTKVVDVQQSVGSLLGLGKGAQITDEILDRIDALNAKQPLTGDAKSAYEQLKKLRDEYGSLKEAQMQLEQQMRDTITGTTAQSLADSIKQGILSGKKSFADFADDIENFLRQGIIAGMSAKVIEPQIQKLQDELAGFLGDGILSADEKKQFQEMYVKIASEAKDYLDLINQSGVNVINTTASANSLQGALKAASQESIELLAGQTGGMRVAQLETNNILKAGAAQQLAANSRMIEIQMNIELNTRRTADNTELTAQNTEKIDRTLKTQYNDLKAAGII